MFALLGIALLLLETFHLVGVLGSASVFPTAFTLSLPVVWLLAFLWKATPAERPPVIVAAVTLLLQLNRRLLGLGNVATVLSYCGSIYLVYFGFTAGSLRLDAAFHDNKKWVLLALVVVLAVVAVILVAP
jgi:hypothetical protein